MDRGAIASWNANTATISTDSSALLNAPFSSFGRVELESPTATTPEELLAAAFASCFTTTLANRLVEAGYPSPTLRTEVRIQLVRPSGYWDMPGVHVHCSAAVAGITEEEFLRIAEAARMHGPIAHTIRAEITLTVSLESLPGRD